VGGFSIWHWLVVLIYIAIVGWPLWRIVGKTGMHPALSLMFHIPLLNIVFFFYMAFSKWPIEHD